MEHTVEVCPAWAEHHRVLLEAIGGGSRPALIEAMVRGGADTWEAVTSFWEAVTLSKQVAVREQEMHQCSVLQAHCRPSVRPRGRPRRHCDNLRPP